MTPLEHLRAKLAQNAGDMAALTAAVQAENRAMTTEEDAQFKKYDEEVRSLEQSIANMERSEELQARLAAPAPRQVIPMDAGASTTGAPRPGATSSTFPTNAHITGGGQVAHNHANHGFTKGFGEFLMKVRDVSTSGRVDPRLMVNAVTTWAGESVGADGGYALPPQFTQGIMSLVTPTDSFVRALNPIPTQSDIITVPVDEDTPWGTTAVTAARTAEGGAITASKIATKPVKVVMHGVKALVHVDEKSLRDMSFLSAYVQRKMGEKIRWKVENYVINGTGENEPLGMLNAPGRYAVAASAGTSTATTLSAFDLGLMEATALPGQGGFWVGHPLIKAQLRTLTSGTAGFPLLQTDFRSGQAIDVLLGYPYYTSEACKAYDTEGDLFFVKPDGYFLAFEAAGVQNDTTIAFAFDQNLQSFRSTLYMGGAPSLSASVTRADGTSKASNIVTLAGSRS